MPSSPLTSFRTLDPTSQGHISTTLLPALLNNLNLDQPADVKQLDKDGTGFVKEEDFMEWFNSGKPNPIGDGDEYDDDEEDDNDDNDDNEYINITNNNNNNDDDDKSITSNTTTQTTITTLLFQVRKLTKSSNAINSSDVHTASWKGDLELVKKYIEIDVNAANAVDGSEFGGGYRPIHYAAYQNHVPLLLHLLTLSTISINTPTSTGCTPLFLASQQGHVDSVKILLLAGADVCKMEKEFGWSAVDVSRLDREVFELFNSGFDGKSFHNEPWHSPPPLLPPCTLLPPNTKNNTSLSPSSSPPSFTLKLPSYTEESDVLKIREFKIKVVSIPTLDIADLIVVPRQDEEDGGEDQIVVVSNNVKYGGKYAVYIAGVNGMGFGEYGDMSCIAVIPKKGDYDDDYDDGKMKMKRGKGNIRKLDNDESEGERGSSNGNGGGGNGLGKVYTQPVRPETGKKSLTQSHGRNVLKNDQALSTHTLSIDQVENENGDGDGKTKEKKKKDKKDKDKPKDKPKPTSTLDQIKQQPQPLSQPTAHARKQPLRGKEVKTLSSLNSISSLQLQSEREREDDGGNDKEEEEGSGLQQPLSKTLTSLKPIPRAVV